MSIDRSKFKKTTASQLVQADKDLNKTMGKKASGNGHEVEEGTNLFRLYPVHPDVAEKDARAVFAVPFVQTFLPAIVQEKDKEGNFLNDIDGKPKMKVTVRPVVNSKVHGGTPKDLVEEYINLAHKVAKDNNMNKEQKEKYMVGIYGAFSRDKAQNINGINYPQVWIVYADKYPAANPSATPVFDELRLKKSVKERLNKIAAVEAANDPMGTDPFTDIEDGRAIKILKDSTAVPATNIYTTELDSTTTNEVVNGKTYKVQKSFPLTDAQLEFFLQQEPLHVKYGKKLATRKNFEAQLTGLEMFDAKFEMGIFDLPEWNDVVQECDSYYPETGEVVTAENTEDVVDEETNQDEFDLMDRKELQAYAKENKTGILVKPSLSDDEVKEKLREWKVSSVIPHVDLPNDDEVKEETAPETDTFLEELQATKPVVEEAKPAVSAKDRLAALRAKTAAAA